jgi:hypothetical protein
MKRVLIIALALSLAAPALAYKVYTEDGKPVRHTRAQMPWVMRFNGLGTPDCANEFTALEAALNTWSNVSYQWYRNKRGSNTSVINFGGDGINVCVWYEPAYASKGQGTWPWAATVIAANAFWIIDVGAFWQVVENDVSFNGYHYTWSDSGQKDKMDVRNIATHEFGHNLVLDDLKDGRWSEVTMYAYSAAGETKKRTLHQDDINGIRFIYPNNAVTLESFTAAPRDGSVVVAWKAAVEVDHAGYNLLRVEDAGGDAAYEKLNGALITGRSPYRYVDDGVRAGTAYRYLLEAVDLSGQKERFGPVRAQLPAGTKGAFALAQSYPNPARDSATITFSLAEAGEAELAVYDLSGRRVATLASGASGAGERDVVWNLTDDGGAAVPPGVYIYRLQGPGGTAARRLVVAR